MGFAAGAPVGVDDKAARVEFFEVHGSAGDAAGGEGGGGEGAGFRRCLAGGRGGLEGGFVEPGVELVDRGGGVEGVEVEGAGFELGGLRVGGLVGWIGCCCGGGGFFAGGEDEFSFFFEAGHDGVGGGISRKARSAGRASGFWQAFVAVDDAGNSTHWLLSLEERRLC